MSLWKWIGGLLRASRILPRMNEKSVIESAKAFAQRERLHWEGPVNAEFEAEECRWNVCTNSESRGGNLHIVIDDRTGQVASYTFLPR